eukprot:Em0001g3722a
MVRDKEPGCDLSSDEELARPLSSKKNSRTTKLANAEAYMTQAEALTDEELLEELRKHGVLAGPILDSTRAVYQKKLAQAMAERAKGAHVQLGHIVLPPKCVFKSRGQAPPPSKELKGELSSQDDEGEIEEVEEEEEEEGEEEEGTRVVATRQFTATMASKPLPQQSGEVRQRHIERVISPASPTKPKKKPVACDWSFWITFLLLVLAFVVAFFAWNHYLTGDTSYITQVCTYLKSRFEW